MAQPRAKSINNNINKDSEIISKTSPRILKRETPFPLAANRQKWKLIKSRATN